jgi:hypothetical protein
MILKGLICWHSDAVHNYIRCLWRSCGVCESQECTPGLGKISGEELGSAKHYDKPIVQTGHELALLAICPYL